MKFKLLRWIFMLSMFQALPALADVYCHEPIEVLSNCRIDSCASSTYRYLCSETFNQERGRENAGNVVPCCDGYLASMSQTPCGVLSAQMNKLNAKALLAVGVNRIYAPSCAGGYHAVDLAATEASK